MKYYLVTQDNCCKCKELMDQIKDDPKIKLDNVIMVNPVTNEGKLLCIENGVSKTPSLIQLNEDTGMHIVYTDLVTIRNKINEISNN